MKILNSMSVLAIKAIPGTRTSVDKVHTRNMQSETLSWRVRNVLPVDD